ncbi:MAG: carbohydrate kinase [Cyanobacteriota bacterium]|nr:carbohydrate kinase [Cyanobacteriota bacterium]
MAISAGGAPQVLCLGEALVDRLGPLGGDPAMAAPADCDDRLGGAPANVACALARLGTPVGFIGRLGLDGIGDSFRELLADRGVDLRGLQSDRHRPSRVVLVRRDASGERVFQGFTGDLGEGFADQALDAQSLGLVWSALADQALWLLVGTIPLATEASALALQAAVQQAAASGVRLALDVNWRPTFWDAAADPAAGPGPVELARMRPLLEQAALIKLAREEAEWLFSSSDPVVISAGLPQRPDVLVTDGGQPVRWCMAGHGGSMPVLASPRVVDTTGAGDAFTAGLLHQLVALTPSAGQPLRLSEALVEQVVRYAAACGALVCAGPGGIDPQPLPHRVMQFLNQLND